ncbi:8-amino-7-oxononanoate synthase [Candidatus Cyrtobacter comes]|uniref:5-aminolevulinate synthase n=1 Tax=Candidatus Cyrtobacter comes TaxID=675776 RepID=A0ABU5L7Q9_9RICK|nr:aminotransferase class I/II-fold pyridoxal phosphate-dependent enzyme [Candidatus Cyrtobacter comes]MDZ5762161.1 8-amino-7-oxononanoate synthase [Candidatus Cyrtobacter comes]
MLECYKNYCNKLQDGGLYRSIEKPKQGLIDFSTNDYLNLRNNKEILEFAIELAHQQGIGSGGSRLLSGNHEIFEKFESQIAIDKKSESALIFSSGFQANFSALSALLNKEALSYQEPVLFFDRSNHSSLYQAAFLSRSKLIRFRHNDMQNLEDLIKEHKGVKYKFIVTETLFGMDGDILPLQDVISIARKYNTFLYIDEAHATGILGNDGYGLSTDYNLDDIPHLIMGTFSKALGGSGAYVACPRIIRDYLINKAAGFIYSTAPAPIIIGAAYKAWKMMKDMYKERNALLFNASSLRKRLKNLGFDIGVSNSHIIPIMVKNRFNYVLELKAFLADSGIVVSAIRPPTSQKEKIRISFCAHHNKEDINFLINILCNYDKSN